MQYNKKQRDFLKKKSQLLRPVVQIGKNGISNEVLLKINTELNNHELIKIKILDGEAVPPKEAAGQLATMSNATLIHKIGKTIILFRENPEGNPLIIKAGGLDLSRPYFRSME